MEVAKKWAHTAARVIDFVLGTVHGNLVTVSSVEAGQQGLAIDFVSCFITATVFVLPCYAIAKSLIGLMKPFYGVIDERENSNAVAKRGKAFWGRVLAASSTQIAWIAYAPVAGVTACFRRCSFRGRSKRIKEE